MSTTQVTYLWWENLKNLLIRCVHVPIALSYVHLYFSGSLSPEQSKRGSEVRDSEDRIYYQNERTVWILYRGIYCSLLFFSFSTCENQTSVWFCLIYWLIDWRHNCISLSSIQAHYVICFMFCMSVFCFVLFYVTTCCYLFCCASQTPVSLHFLCFPENGTGLLQANQNNKHQDPQKCTEEANGFVLSLLLC